MIRRLKKVTVRGLAIANVVAIAAMLLVGYSDRLDPVGHTLLCNAGLAFPVVLAVNVAFLVFWAVFKFRMVVVPFIGFVLCFVPVRKYTPFNIRHDVPADAVKVLSYNVWLFGGGTDKSTGNPILQYIKRQDADLVCLQESDGRQVGQDVVDSVLNPIYAWRDTAVSFVGGDMMTVYSKYPILRHEHIDIDSRSNQATAFWIDMNGSTVILIGCHLQTTGLSAMDKTEFKELVKGDMERDSIKTSSANLVRKLGEATAKRGPQADAIASFIRRHRQGSIILCGDFNDSPISYVHRTIAQDLTDCYIATGNGPGISYHRGGFYVRIDNMMCSEDWTPYRCHVDNQIDASDHYPIVCWFEKRR